MELPRRKFLSLAAAAATLPAVSRIASAQAYPARPVRVIVPYPPAGTIDLCARVMGQWLSERLGQQFVIENRPGGGGIIGTEAAINTRPDGYTLLLASAGNAISASLYDKLSFNFIRDTVPIAGIARYPNVLEVNPSFPVKTVPEFIAYAKSNPGKISIASGGTATAPHLAIELFKMMAGIDMVHVPYRGSAPLLTDLLGGQVQVAFDPIPASIGHIKAGKLHALAVTSTTRSEALPDVPTMADFLPGFEASGWNGFSTPKGTPVEIVGRLNTEINAGLADPTVKRRLSELSTTVLAGSPADFGRLIADETEKWGKVIRFADIKAG